MAAVQLNLTPVVTCDHPLIPIIILWPVNKYKMKEFYNYRFATFVTDLTTFENL